MSKFLVSEVPNAGITEDGTSVIIRVSDGDGNELDLIASYTAFEQITNALNEAAIKAHERRRERGIVDTSVGSGDATQQKFLGFRYMVADDRSHMILRVLTPGGHIDIQIPASMANDFRAATDRNCELLASPPRKSAH